MKKDNIQDYAGLYKKNSLLHLSLVLYLLSLEGLPLWARYFEKLYTLSCGLQIGLYYLGLTPLSIIILRMLIEWEIILKILN